MADNIEKIYFECEEKCREVWNDAKSELVRCFAYYNYRILAISKFYFGPLLLPSGTRDSEEAYRKAVQLISDPNFEILEERKAFNWTRSNKAVTPLIVPRDGNSLCHSVSVLIFGIPDQKLTIRRWLYQTCVMHKEEKSPLYDRWSRFMKKICNELGREYNIVGLRQEWSDICESSSLISISDAPHTKYYPLKQYHIFILSQVLRRPIVVACLEEGGFKPSVYLPLYIPVDECIKSPLYITYRQGHFAPLVFVDEANSTNRFGDLCFPIVDHNFRLYEFPFLFDNEDPMFSLAKYARVTTIGFTTINDFKELPALRIHSLDARSASGCDDPGFDPSAIPMKCFSELEHHRNPNDVFLFWKHVLELKRKFRTESMEISSATSIGPSYQPADDAEDDEDDGASYLHPPDPSFVSEFSPENFILSSEDQPLHYEVSPLAGKSESLGVHGSSHDIQNECSSSTFKQLPEPSGSLDENIRKRQDLSLEKNCIPNNESQLLNQSKNSSENKKQFSSNCSAQRTSPTFSSLQSSRTGRKNAFKLGSLPPSPRRVLNKSVSDALAAQSANLIHHSSADRSSGYGSGESGEQYLHSIDHNRFKEEHSLTQASSRIGGVRSSERLTTSHAGRGSSSGARVEGFRTSSWIGRCDTETERASRRTSPNGHSTTHHNISGEYKVVQKRKDQIRIMNPSHVVFYIGCVEVDGKKVIFHLLKSGLALDDPVKLHFPERENDISINYSLTTEALVCLKLRDTESGLRLDVVRPRSIEIDSSASLMDNAAALVGLDIEPDSPFFDFRDNPTKCRTAGCMGRAVRQNRNLCNSCHDAWRRMLRRTEDSSTFSYFDSVSSIGSRVDENSCRNRSCAGTGEKRFYGFCEHCFHSSAVEW